MRIDESTVDEEFSRITAECNGDVSPRASGELRAVQLLRYAIARDGEPHGVAPGARSEEHVVRSPVSEVEDALPRIAAIPFHPSRKGEIGTVSQPRRQSEVIVRSVEGQSLTVLACDELWCAVNQRVVAIAGGVSRIVFEEIIGDRRLAGIRHRLLVRDGCHVVTYIVPIGVMLPSS